MIHGNDIISTDSKINLTCSGDNGATGLDSNNKIDLTRVNLNANTNDEGITAYEDINLSEVNVEINAGGSAISTNGSVLISNSNVKAFGAKEYMTVGLQKKEFALAIYLSSMAEL